MCSINLQLKRQGFDKLLTRVTNEKMANMYVLLGGEILVRTTFDFDGNTNDLFFLELQFNNPMFNNMQEILKIPNMDIPQAKLWSNNLSFIWYFFI